MIDQVQTLAIKKTGRLQQDPQKEVQRNLPHLAENRLQKREEDQSSLRYTRMMPNKYAIIKFYTFKNNCVNIKYVNTDNLNF